MMMMMVMMMMMMKKLIEVSRNEEVNFRHPSAQMDDTENLTNHWPCAVKTCFPGQHIRPGRINKYIYIYIYICIYIYIYLHLHIYIYMFLFTYMIYANIYCINIYMYINVLTFACIDLYVCVHLFYA